VASGENVKDATMKKKHAQKTSWPPRSLARWHLQQRSLTPQHPELAALVD